MSLRLRLIVVFFLLSVVPLAAVTLYNYTSNLQAVREAAANEAELLAEELSQRMQLVTAQLGQGLERVMSSSEGTGASQQPVAAPPVVEAVAEPVAAGGAASNAASASAAAMQTRTVTDALGPLAMLLDNVEVRGTRGRGGRGGGGRGGRGGPPPGSPPGPAFAPGSPPPPGTPAVLGTSVASPREGAPQTAATDGARASQGAPTLSADPFAPGRGGARGDGSRFGGGRRGPPSGDPNAPDGRRGGPPPDPLPDNDPTRIRIDLAPVWREVMQEFVPDGDLDKLSPEERTRVFAEVNQRMLGIQKGIQILQARVAERVADARAETASQPPASPPAPSLQAAAPTTPSAPKAPAAPAPKAPSTQTAAKRTTTLSGSQLAVRMMRDGEVVSEASADINLPNLLSAVFTTTNRRRGEVPFAVAKDGQLHAPTAVDRQTVESIGTTAVQPNVAAGTSFDRGWIVVTTADPGGSGLKFGIARPLGEAVADLRRTTALNAAFGFGLIVLALAGIVPLSSRLTRNLQRLSEGVNRIAQGDYGARVTVRSKDDVGRLATAFNRMAADVEAHQRSIVDRERLRRELELGRQIQHDMQPQVPLRLGLTEVKGVSVPAREVGGDFFNYFQLSNGTLALIVGDVSGKGVGAALLMANIQASLRTRLSLGQDLAAIARELDRDIEDSTPGPVYATLFVGIFDPATRLLRCVNAGHNPQYVIRRDGRLERMEASGLPIGLLAGHGYAEQRVQLDAGDLLFFYTDGSVEASNTTGDMFGMERLEAALAASAGADDMLVAVEAEVTRFRAGIELADDATMMVVKVG